MIFHVYVSIFAKINPLVQKGHRPGDMGVYFPIFAKINPLLQKGILTRRRFFG